MLLRFRVANHRSLREEQELSLVAAPRRGEASAKPQAGKVPPTVRVAGVYGANASGKSNVLDALRWMRWAVENSHTRWAPDEGVPRVPFRLDDASRTVPSFYEVDFVFEGIRYSYGFEVTDTQVTAEWLFRFPKGRPQRMFEREGAHDYRFGRALTGELRQIQKLTRENALYLSAAASNNHPLLSAIHHRLSRHIKAASQMEQEERTRLEFTARLLEEPETAEQVNRLVRIADLGISAVRVSREPVDEDFFTNLLRPFNREIMSESDLERLREHLERTLVFSHGSPEGSRTLPVDQESGGTRAWLALIGPILQVLKHGDVFLVDEIDSSLHPVVSATMIKMFKDPEINPKGAQLVFASHDTTLLGRLLAENLLERDEVWFTEKDARGGTSLYSLVEFRPRGEENIERGYLQGRYDAVPYVDFARIRELFAAIHGAADESAEESEAGSGPPAIHP